MSFRVGLLKLMMAGSSVVLFGFYESWIQFVISEMLNIISILVEEGISMIIKKAEANSPYRFNLLMSQ